MSALSERFDDCGIAYRSYGKNVGRENINICCPFCGEERFHCGIHRAHLYFHCWVCGVGGSWKKLKNLLRSIYPNVSWDINNNENYTDSEVVSDAKSEFKIRDYFTKRAEIGELNWLTKIPAVSELKNKFRTRGLPEKILNFYDIRLGIGKYENYVGFAQGENLIARKYRPDKNKLMHLKSVDSSPFIFNFGICNRTKPKIGVITEGVMDCLRFPYGSSIALLTSNCSDSVIGLIANCFNSADRIILALDRGVKWEIICNLKLILIDLGYEVIALDWNKIKNRKLKDVDELTLVYGDKFLLDLFNLREVDFFSQSNLI